jgi:hypothetical protein
MKTKMSLLLAVVMAFSITGAVAQSYHNANNNQDQNKYGYRSGKMNAAEARRRAYHDQQFRKDIKRAKCDDGRISRAERARIMHRQQMQKRQIYSYNQNKRNRF